MKQLVIFILVSLFGSAFGQTENKQEHKISFFLLKSIKPNLDSAVKFSAPFSVSLADLEDTEFINDNEILKYTLRKDTVKSQDSFHIYTSQMFEVSPEVTKRVNSLEISLCCGRQFALVIDGSIVSRELYYVEL